MGRNPESGFTFDPIEYRSVMRLLPGDDKRMTLASNGIFFLMRSMNRVRI